MGSEISSLGTLTSPSLMDHIRDLPAMDVKVTVTGVDYEKRQIDMVLDEKKPSRGGPRGHRKR